MQRIALASSGGTTVIVVTIVVNVVLMASKIAAGVLFGSVGLVADGMHFLIDIFGAILVLIGLLAAITCYQSGYADLKIAAILGIGFFFGAFF